MPMVGAKGAPDPKRALLVVTGDTDEAVKLAAITFTNISFRFPGSDELEAFGFSIPDVKQYSGRETIATDQVYELATLDFPTQSFVGINPGARSITFRLPPDFHIRPNQYAKLSINFSYGAGLKNDSSFSIAVNGRACARWCSTARRATSSTATSWRSPPTSSSRAPTPSSSRATCTRGGRSAT